MRRIIITAVLLSTVALAGCGGGHDKTADEAYCKVYDTTHAGVLAGHDPGTSAASLNASIARYRDAASQRAQAAPEALKDAWATVMRGTDSSLSSQVNSQRAMDEINAYAEKYCKLPGDMTP